MENGVCTLDNAPVNIYEYTTVTFQAKPLFRSKHLQRGHLTVNTEPEY